MTLSSLRRFPFFRLLLAGAVGFFWFRSHSRSDLACIFLHKGQLQVIVSDRGRVILATTNIEFGAARAYTWDGLSVSNAEFDKVRELLYETTPTPEHRVGMYLGGSPIDPFTIAGAHYRYVIMPYWYPAGLVALALLLGLRTFWKRRHWGSAGICAGCGYDVRFSSDRCPECGTAIKSKRRGRGVEVVA
jgi:hypothetical protein